MGRGGERRDRFRDRAELAGLGASERGGSWARAAAGFGSRSRPASALPCLLIALSAALVSLPLLLWGPSCGHDFDFHLQSWLAVREAWRAGLPAPHWVSGANYGAGEPRLVFYPPLSWVLGAMLGSALPWQAVPAAFTLLALAGAGLSLYRLACRWMSPVAATLAACGYLANPYLLFVAYERTAYGELLAAVWMPLLLLYALRPRPLFGRLSLVVAALWFTNAPAAVMGCYLLALCAVTTAVAARSRRPAVHTASALALGSGLAGVYLAPAWYEQRWVAITRAVDPGMRVQDSYLFAHTGQAYHDQVLHTASLLAVGILGAGLACLTARRLLQHSARPLPETAGLDRFPPRVLSGFLLTVFAAILFLLLPVSDPLWRHAPQLRFLQFPWRWLLVAGLAASLAAGALGDSLGARIRKPSRLLLTLASVLVLACAWGAGLAAQHTFAQPCDDEDNIAAQQALLAPSNGDDPPGFEGTDEYTPSGADNGEIQQGLPVARLLRSPGDDEGDDSITPNPDWRAPAQPIPGKVSILQWTPEHHRLTVVTTEPSTLVLRLMDYPAWQLRVNGRPFTARLHREDGLLTLPVDRGATRIEIDWRTTPDVIAGRTLSLLSLLALTAVAVARRQLRHKPEGAAARL